MIKKAFSCTPGCCRYRNFCQFPFTHEIEAAQRVSCFLASCEDEAEGTVQRGFVLV